MLYRALFTLVWGEKIWAIQLNPKPYKVGPQKKNKNAPKNGPTPLGKGFFLFLILLRINKRYPLYLFELLVPPFKKIPKIIHEKNGLKSEKGEKKNKSKNWAFFK